MEDPLLRDLRRDPSLVLGHKRVGMTPDPWQTDILRSASKRILLCASRQSGKSQACAGKVLVKGLIHPKSLVLLLGRAERQANELFRKVVDLYNALGQPVAKANDMSSELHLANGSRIIPLPGTGDTVRSFSAVSLLAIDEAGLVPDSLYHAVRPMLAVSGGTLVCLSSAWARQGFFFEAWDKGAEDPRGISGWKKVAVKGVECPRISREFLEEERQAMGDRIFSREYENEFLGDDSAAFDADAVARALAAPMNGPPLF
jgi:hypothetical protein